MELEVYAERLTGSIAPPPFKSEVIRVLILNALCGKAPSALIAPDARHCDDVRSAARAVKAAFLSGEVCDRENPIPVGSSGALIRMLAPLLLFLHGRASFSCEPSLMRRSMSDITNTLGCDIEYDHSKGTVFFSGGRLNGKYYTVHASNSSQFASGMLIASALLGFAVRIVTPVSVPYIELTLNCLSEFGCKAVRDSRGYLRFKGELNAQSSYVFQPDLSYAANFIAADLIGGGRHNISIPRSERALSQSDSRASELFEAAEPNIKDAPDLFPLLCVYALKKHGETVISGTARLRDKESDRVEASLALVEALGGRAEVLSDRVKVYGCGGKLHGGHVSSFGDHRIVMAASVASLMCASPVIIHGAEAVSKSAPGFFDDFRRLGGTANEFIRK